MLRQKRKECRGRRGAEGKERISGIQDEGRSLEGAEGIQGRKERRDEGREEGSEEGREEGREDGREDGTEEGRKEGTDEGTEEE